MSKAIQIESLWSGLLDDEGNPISGGKVYTYTAGTTTLNALYTDRDKVSSATNPIILDTYGRAEVYGAGLYKFVVKDSDDVILYDMDNLEYIAREGGSLDDVTINPTTPAPVTGSDLTATSSFTMIDQEFTTVNELTASDTMYDETIDAGVTVNDFVYHDGTDWKQAMLSTLYLPNGVCLNIADGMVTTNGYASGFAGLTAGDNYYLQSDGSITNATATSVIVGKAISATEMIINIKRLDTGSETKNGIISGVELASSDGFPGFLAAGGAADLDATLDATSEDFVVAINNISVTIDADITFTCVGGFGANNTCLVDDAIYAADPEFSKTEGEFGATYITVDAAGSEITGAVGEYHFFEITNGVGTELFFAFIESAIKLIPIYRGLGGTSRIAFTDNDTITIGKGNYFFVDADGNDYNTVIFPLNVDVLPAAGTANLYAHRMSDDTWHLDSGAAWSQVERIPVGFGVAMNATDNTYVGYLPYYNDFVKSWDGLLRGDIKYKSATLITVPIGFTVSVAGVAHVANTEVDVDLSAAGDRESGVSEAASTLYYLYVNDNFKFYFSNICPRPIDGRQGYYHPSKYWRCVGTVFNDASGNIVPFSYKDGKYIYMQDGTGAADINLSNANGNILGQITLTTSYAVYENLLIPPMVNLVSYTYYQQTGAGVVYNKSRSNTYSVVRMSIPSVPSMGDTGDTLLLVQNSTLSSKVSTNTAILNPVWYEVKY